MSIFGQILAELLGELPGAAGAVFIDWEGEAVDSATSTCGATSIRLVGAHWGVIYAWVRRMCERLDLGAPLQVMLTFERERIVVDRVSEGYYLVVACGCAQMAPTLRAVQHARERLRQQL